MSYRASKNQIAARSAAAPVDTATANKRRFTALAVTTIWVLRRRITAAALRSAKAMIRMARSRNEEAIARGNQGGCIDGNSAWKPTPSATDANAVRIHPAKVRSFARMVRSSASSVRERSCCSAIEIERAPEPHGAANNIVAASDPKGAARERAADAALSLPFGVSSAQAVRM